MSSVFVSAGVNLSAAGDDQTWTRYSGGDLTCALFNDVHTSLSGLEKPCLTCPETARFFQLRKRMKRSVKDPVRWAEKEDTAVAWDERRA